MRAKIADIAKIAGLSSASVSRILNGRGRYSEETAKRVKKIANEIGYYKNRSASDLASQRNNTIGVINYIAETGANDQVIKGILEEADRNNIDVIMMMSKRDDQTAIAKTVQSMIERRVLGVIFLSVRPDQEIIDRLRYANIYPQEVASASDNRISYISSNDFQIGYQATKFLLDQGYQRIGFVGANISEDYIGVNRYKGYLEALKEKRIKTDPGWVFEGDGKYSYQSGLDAAKYYENMKGVDAVLATSDDAALGLSNGLYDLQRKVPDNIAVIGIDGTAVCLRTRPQITSVTQNFHLMGQMAVDEVINPARQIDDIQKIQIPFTIDVRETTK
ncbi:LacI family DNA-binding transcriptional regulator [Lentilactobacillus hilgardii]|uniref:Substrate-binding domain-containing protein n=1 Tax=Lentilactobacillus hilgardii TaxID=1588 RepID=A0A6P1E711_LENHI|nr:LacI family DNA-binding transcriptional regulator [Lentilactobacillus hilgardii]EEI72677.1 transcriptional regulator, LacI family [Lentilactobacillus hilgardii ATCC 27305]MCT3390767.1 LacI family transcriptional regulator [Lentilactobacillus hilgardii]QHB53107.1 substrate-binding domain-containing protein [Lentilactobacillus hilgardii]RRG07675.1 MAG: LacI family transcriptional regulator [Lactobacillus sp.]